MLQKHIIIIIIIIIIIKCLVIEEYGYHWLVHGCIHTSLFRLQP